MYFCSSNSTVTSVPRAKPLAVGPPVRPTTLRLLTDRMPSIRLAVTIDICCPASGSEKSYSRRISCSASRPSASLASDRWLRDRCDTSFQWALRRSGGRRGAVGVTTQRMRDRGAAASSSKYRSSPACCSLAARLRLVQVVLTMITDSGGSRGSKFRSTRLTYTSVALSFSTSDGRRSVYQKAFLVSRVLPWRNE
jgi:hypothetical protein